MASQTRKFTQNPSDRRKSTYANGKLELERRPLKERGAVIIAACHQSVRPALLDVHTVDDFVVSRDLAYRRATVPQEDGSEPLPNERRHRKKESVPDRRTRHGQWSGQCPKEGRQCAPAWEHVSHKLV